MKFDFAIDDSEMVPRYSQFDEAYMYRYALNMPTGFWYWLPSSEWETVRRKVACL